MALQHDEQGFLLGQKVEQDDLLASLGSILDELKEISRKLSGGVTKPSAMAQKSTEVTTSTLPPVAAKAKPGVLQPAPKSEKSGRFVGSKTPESDGEKSAEVTKPEIKIAVEPQKAAATQTSPPSATPAAATAPAKGAVRDSSGRFVGSKTPESDGEKSSNGDLGAAIGGLGDRLAGAVGGLAVNEEADPAVKAFREVAQPLSRGFGKIMGGGGGTGEDRWYRRFWRHMRGNSKREKKQEARVLEQLEDIEDAQGGDSKGGILSRLFAPILAMLSGILKALVPLGLLAKIASALGFKNVAARTKPTGASPTQRTPKTAPTSTANAARKPSGGGKGLANAARRGGGKLLRGAGKLAKRIPLLGTLLSVGLAAKDVHASESSDMTRKEKDTATGSAVGRGVGGLGGVAAGAAAGAAIGSVVPVIGTAIGGVVGAAVGGWLGDSAGDIVGSKMGEWVGDLRDSDIGGAIVGSWNTAADFVSHLWGQASTSVKDRWNAVTDTVSGAWGAVTGKISDAWGGVSGAITSKWDAVTDSLSAGWESALGGMSEAWNKVTGLAGQWWGSIKDTAGKANDWVKEKTGVDISEAVSTAGQAVKETYEGAKDKAGEVVTGAKEKLADAGNWLVDSLKSAVSTAYEATGIKSGVDAVRRSADHAEGKQALRQAMADSGIVDPMEQAAFMGQMDHESAGFTQTEESMNYSPERFLEMFGKRAGISSTEEASALLAQGDVAVGDAMYGGEWGKQNLGNTEEGDGHRFRGRGYTQLTGRDNYTAAGEALGVDLVNNPDMAADPDMAAKIATWYWKSNPGIQEAAKAGDTEAVTRKINGGTNGLDERAVLTKEYLAEARSGDLNATPKQNATPQQDVAASAPDAKADVASAPAKKDQEPFSNFNSGNPHTDKKVAKARARIAARRARHERSSESFNAPSTSVSVSASPKSVRVPSAQAAAVADQPSVSTPMGGNKPSSGGGQQAQRDVSRNLSDGRIAHIVTGAYSGAG